MTVPEGVLERFSPATRDWFSGAFGAPTAAQAGAWDAVADGEHALVVAPTGSGKTLAAFLWALDRLAAAPVPEEPQRRCRVLYVSPMKALTVDVQRNLRSPLAGLRQATHRLGLPEPDITVGSRTGDTPADERRSFNRTPPDVLVTTPESLFLLLTSAARESLRGVETVIVDEVHAVLASKRGAHLALSLERLDALLDAPAQRIGLSATVRPVEEVSTFLAGGRPVRVVQPRVGEDRPGQRRRPGRGHERTGRRRHCLGSGGRGGGRGLGGRGGAAGLDLARGPGEGARPRRVPPLDDRLRELPSPGRAAHRADQRAGHRARRAPRRRAGAGGPRRRRR